MSGRNQASTRPMPLRSGRWAQILFCVMAFGLTGPAVYLIGLGEVGKSAAYRATAIVHQRFVSTHSDGPKSLGQTGRPRVSDVRRQILSDGNLRRAALGLKTPTGGSDDDLAKLVARIRERLTVEVRETSRNRLRIAITAVGQETELILQLVNDLAKQVEL